MPRTIGPSARYAAHGAPGKWFRRISAQLIRDPTSRTSSVPSPSSPPINDESAAIVHQTYIGIWDREADRFWVRNNLLLLVNGALLSIAATADAPRGLRLILCGFGIYFSIHWVLINSKGSYYVARWRPAIEAYESSLVGRPTFSGMPLLSVPPDRDAFASPMALKQRIAILRGRGTPRRETGHLMHAIIVGFVLGWVALAIFYSVHDTSGDSTRAVKSASEPAKTQVETQSTTTTPMRSGPLPSTEQDARPPRNDDHDGQ